MQPECIPPQLDFEGLRHRRVVGRFDGGRLTTDGGVLLLREVDRRFRVTERLAGCFRDHRSAGRIEHRLETLVAQRVLGLAAGYADLNDHDRLRTDSVLALASGCVDVTGERRRRARDRGSALAGSSTLNRLELSVPEAAAGDRYRKIVADPAAMDALLVDLFLEAHAAPPGEIVLDLDATDDPLHGKQEGRFFHGYYRTYCYLPLYITCGDFVLCARLRPANIDAPEGSVAELERIVAQIRAAWPAVRILVRGDAGFCRDDLMAWCEAAGLDYVFGLARNPRLQRWLGKALGKSRRRCIATGRASRRFRERRYRTRTSWSRARRVVGKAEWLPGRRGDNPRFVVTNLPADQVSAQPLYERVYCGRGEMENRIKEQQLWLFADRTSTATMRANQLRLTFATFAGVLMTLLRQVGLQGTALARAQADTIRTRLLKIGARITVSRRRIRIAFASVYPLQQLFAHVLAALRAPPTRAGPG
ncbi:MAG: IS1380 family transposase [Chloroflexi bacterium]|nr:IS1380 family transposase [Chloroflexota bacterium]